MTKSKNKPLRYGLYGEEDFLLPDFIHCEILEYRSLIRSHLHASLFQMFLIEAGKISVLFEMSRKDALPGSIIVIPENTLHGLEVSKDVKGMVITLSTSFIETIFQSSFHVLTELGTPKVLSQMKEHNLFNSVCQIAYSLHKELEDDLPEKRLALQNYLCLLLINVYRLSIEKSEKPITSESSKTQHFRDFRRSIKTSYSPRKTIKQYAQELHITPEYLNRVCQATVGKSALQVVHDFFFMEAKKHLKYTGYTISGIAHQLNFEDPAYFSRFFSRMAGCSPKTFRESIE